MKIRQRLLRVTMPLKRVDPRGLTAFASLAVVTTGLWWERPSLALIIPGTIVFVCLAWSHLKGEKDA